MQIKQPFSRFLEIQVIAEKLADHFTTTQYNIVALALYIKKLFKGSYKLEKF